MQSAEKKSTIFGKYAKMYNLHSLRAQDAYSAWKSDIQETLREKNLSLEQIEWVMSEKIHGSNFSFIIGSDSQIDCFRRNGKLKPGDHFNNWQKILEQNTEPLEKLEKIIQTDYFPLQKIDQIQVYGEIFGGFYPHEEVPKIKEAKIVQKSIYYSPQNEFQAFDISVTLSDENDNSQKEIKLPWLQVKDVCEKSGIRMVKPLKIGKFEDLITYNVENFISTLYKEYNLPEISGNIGEGVVIRPVSISHGPLFKNKSLHFEETKSTAGVAFSEEKQDFSAIFSDFVENSEKYMKKLREMAAYFTKARLESVLSKLTEKEKKNKNYLIKLLCQDAIEDFEGDGQENVEFLKEAREGNSKLNTVIHAETMFFAAQVIEAEMPHLSIVSYKKQKNSQQNTNNKKN